MVRHSTIDRLPEKLRDLIKSLRHNGHTIDEILDKLRELDVEVSRSAMGRHVVGVDALKARMEKSWVWAKALAPMMEGKNTGDLARLNLNLLQAGIAEMLVAEDLEEGVINLEPKSAKLISEALRNAISAAKVDLDRELKLREEARKEAKREAAEQLDRVTAEASAAGEKGLSSERIAQLRRDFLGVRPAA